MADNDDLARRRARLTPEQRQRLTQRLRTGSDSARQTPTIPRRPTNESAHLSYAQQRHWFLWQLDPQSTAYHLGGALRLLGKLDIEALQASFQGLITRHESLRTVFQRDEAGLPQQKIDTQEKFELMRIDLCDLPVAQRTQRAHKEAIRINTTPFDLTQGPLLRVALIRVAAEEHRKPLTLPH